MFHEHVVELSDEMAGQLVFVRLLGDDRLPRPAEVVDEAGEGNDHGLAEQGGLRAEVTEEKGFGDASSLSDLAGGGTAVVLTGEEDAGGIKQESPGLASGTARRPGRCCCRHALIGRRSLGHGRSLFQPTLGGG